MRRFKIILLSGIFFLMFSYCIEPYSPDIDSQASGKIVVDGFITDQEGYQIVSISTTSSVMNPTYNPLSKCEVKIVDSLGNTFNLVEFTKGQYRSWIGKEYLTPGNSYQVRIKTESGIEIVSEMDKMPECPEIDSVYYLREEFPTDNIYKPRQALQFCIDLDGGNTNSHYYRWELTETWEHRSTYPNSLYWNGKDIVPIIPADFSKFYCWTTEKVKNIYTLSTENLTENKYKMFKINSVDNTNIKLTYCYSLLVEQHALSKTAYKFWNDLRINSNEQGGLYGTQPLRVMGNLKSTSNPELVILGFFGASAVKSKRILVYKLTDFNFYYPNYCEAQRLGANDLRRGIPQYLVNVDGDIRKIQSRCVICTEEGGTTVKPDYWPSY